MNPIARYRAAAARLRALAEKMPKSLEARYDLLWSTTGHRMALGWDLQANKHIARSWNLLLPLLAVGDALADQMAENQRLRVALRAAREQVSPCSSANCAGDNHRHCAFGLIAAAMDRDDNTCIHCGDYAPEIDHQCKPAPQRAALNAITEAIEREIGGAQ